MFFRDPTKYKYTTPNIIVGNAELHVVEVRGNTGWALPGGGVVYDKDQAIKYATKMNALIQHSTKMRNARRIVRV